MDDQKERDEELKEAFDIFDKNKSSTISVDELSSVFRSLGYNFSMHDINKMVSQYTTSTELSFEDFKKLLQQQEKKQAESEDDLREAFEVFDRDANGFITVEELKLVAKSLGETISDNDLEEMIKHASGQDTKVSLKQFVEVYMKP